MLIVIDLSGDGETVVEGNDPSAVQLQADEERKRREDYLEWIRIHEQVVPQIIPVESSR